MLGGWTLVFGGRCSSEFPSLIGLVTRIAIVHVLTAVPAHALTGFALEDTLVHPTGGSFAGVVASGDTVMAGNGTFPESVHVFQRNASGQWPLAQTITNANIPSGIRVISLDGDTALLWGLIPGSTTSDRWFVYIRQAGQWALATELTAAASVMLGAGDSSVGFGALDGDRVVLTATQTTKANPVTSLLVYDRPSLGWNQTASLSPTSTVNLSNSAGDRLRIAGISGDAIGVQSNAIAAPSRPTIEVWELSGSTWSQTARLVQSGSAPIGSSAAIFDGEAAALAFWDGTNFSTVAINVFNRPAGGWFDKSQDAELTIGSGNGTTLLGFDGTTIVAREAAFAPANVFHIFDSPVGAWSSPGTTQQPPITTPAAFNAISVGGRTIVALPYVYRASDPRVDLSVEKVESADPITAREDFTYTFTVRNESLNSATNVTLIDDLIDEIAYVSHTNPTGGTCMHTNAVDDGTGRLVGGSFQCSIATLAAQANVNITLTVDAPAKTTFVSNSVTVTSAEADINSNNNSSSITTTVELPQLSDSQGPDNDRFIDFGSVVLNNSETQTVAVIAHGNAPTTVAAVNLSNPNPPYSIDASACIGQALNPTQLCIIDVTFEPTVVGSPQENTMTIDFGEYSLDVALTGAGSLVLITDTQGDPQDRLVDFGFVFVEQFAQHTVTIGNQTGAALPIGPIALDDPLEPDPPFSIPADSCSNISLADGASCTFDVRFEADDERPLTTDTFSIPVGAGIETFTVQGVSVLEELDISVSKSGPISVNSGAVDTFTVSVSSSGGSASGVIVQDVLPSNFLFIEARNGFGQLLDASVYDPVSGIWNIGDLSAGETVDLLIYFTADENFFQSDPVTPLIGCRINNATLIGLNEQDVDPDNNEASFYTAVNTPTCADVAVTDLTESEDPVLGGLYVGGTGTYTVTVENLSPPQVAQGTRVTFAVSGSQPGFQIIIPSGNILAPDCVFANPNDAASVVCTIGDFTGTEVFTFDVQGPRSGGTATLTAEIEAAFTLDPDAANNTATETTVFNPENVPIPRIPDAGSCPIGIFTTGSFLQNHLGGLRRFRDRYLMATAPGHAFVDWYYETGPSVIALAERYPILRVAALFVLTPIIYAFAFPLATALSLVLSFAAMLALRRGRWRGIQAAINHLLSPAVEPERA